MLFYILLIFVLIEQVCYFMLLKYPGRYGIIVKKIAIEDPSNLIFDANGKYYSKNLLIKKNIDNKDLFIRYKYDFITGSGPFIFVGHIDNRRNLINIRVGVFIFILWAYFLVLSFLAEGTLKIALIIIVIWFVYFFYMRFVRSAYNVFNKRST